MVVGEGVQTWERNNLRLHFLLGVTIFVAIFVLPIFLPICGTISVYVTLVSAYGERGVMWNISKNKSYRKNPFSNPSAIATRKIMSDICDIFCYQISYCYQIIISELPNTKNTRYLQYEATCIINTDKRETTHKKCKKLNCFYLKRSVQLLVCNAIMSNFEGIIKYTYTCMHVRVIARGLQPSQVEKRENKKSWYCQGEWKNQRGGRFHFYRS